jgi:hypothetical protein
MEFHKHLDYNYNTLMHPIIFLFMQGAHTLYMDIKNLVFVQIKFKLFTNRYFYIHPFLISMGYIHGS